MDRLHLSRESDIRVFPIYPLLVLSTVALLYLTACGREPMAAKETNKKDSSLNEDTYNGSQSVPGLYGSTGAPATSSDVANTFNDPDVDKGLDELLGAGNPVEKTVNAAMNASSPEAAAAALASLMGMLSKLSVAADKNPKFAEKMGALSGVLSSIGADIQNLVQNFKNMSKAQKVAAIKSIVKKVLGFIMQLLG